jgi:putative transposase
MANTYSRICHHYVFAVKNRERLIDDSIKEELEKYICGIASNLGQKILAIYCMPDHVHILVGLTPTISDSKLMAEIKANSSRFVNERYQRKVKFQWQDGYGVFSHSRNAIDGVVKYILNQKEHHRSQTFREEYINMLQEAQVDFKLEYVFDFFDEA